MDKTLLEDRLKDLESQFQAVNQRKAENEKKVGDDEAELFRLQGDYRTIQNLIRESTPQNDIPPDPATTNAKPKRVKDAATS